MIYKYKLIYIYREDQTFTIGSCLNNAEAYTELDDTIIHRIIDTDNTDLPEAKKIALNILTRQFYYCVCESQPLDGKVHNWPRNLTR